MNNIYKVIWSKAKNCYVVASEIAKSHTKSASGSEKMGGYGKRALLALAAASAIFCGGLVNVGASVQSETISAGTTSNRVLTVDNTDDAAQLNKVILAAREDKLVTKDNIGGQLTDYAKASDLSAKADANDVYSKTAAEDKFATKTELGSYAESANVYSKTEADGKFATIEALNDKPDKTYVDNAVAGVNTKLTDYAKTDDVDMKLAGKADKATTLVGYGINDAYTKDATDAAITTKVNEEKNARELKDSALSGRIDTLSTTVDSKVSKTDLNTTLGNYYTQAETNAAIKTAVEDEKNARENAINGEVTERNKAIDDAIAREVTNRDAAITKEETKRKEEDAKLDRKITENTTAINNEKAAREAAVTDLSKRIGTVDEDGKYIKKSTTNNVSENLKVLDTQANNNAEAIKQETADRKAAIGQLAGDGKYIKKAKNVSENLVELDTQVKTNAEAIAQEAAKREEEDNKINTKIGSIDNNQTEYVKQEQTISQNLTKLDKELKDTNDRTRGITRNLEKTQTTIEGAVKVDKQGNVKDVKGLSAETITTGALTVTGASDLKGDVTLGTPNGSNTVAVNGTANFNAAVNMDKGLTVTNGKTKLKDTNVEGNLKVTGTITTDKMVFGDKATNNYTEIDKGHITSKNDVLAGDATKKSSSMELDHTKLEVGVTDKDSKGHLTMTADKTTIKNSDLDGKNYSEIVADKDSVTTTVKDEKDNTTSTKSSATEIRNYAKDKDGNESSIVQTGKDITNTAEKGTITSKAKDIVNDASGNISNKSQTMDTTVTGRATESYGELETTVKGNQTTTVEGNVKEDYKHDLTTTVGGNELHEVKGIKTENVTGKVTENYNGGQETNVTGDQVIKVSGTQTTTATDINRNASSGMIDTIDNDYGTNTETKVAGKTTTDVSIKGTGEKGQYIRGANESRDYLIKGTLKNSETKTVEKTSTEITDGNGNTSSTIQDVKNLAGSLTNGTEIGVSGIHANDNGSVSIDSVVIDATDTNKYSMINQKKGSIQSTVVDGTNSTVILQDKDNVTIASSKGTVAIGGKDIVNNAQETITNTAGTSITNQVKDSKVTTDASGTTFENKTAAVSDGGTTTTKINGNLINTGRVDANELGVSDKDGDNTADFSVKAGEGVKASAGNGTTKGSLDVKADEVKTEVKDDSTGKHTNTSQTADGINGYATDKDGNKTYTKVTATENSFQVQDKNGENTNHQVNTKDMSENTITNGDKANTVTSTADGTTFKNSKAAAPVTGASGAGKEVNTTIKGNTITTGKVTMDYAEVMKDLGVTGNTTTGSLEVKGESKLTGKVTMENDAIVGHDLTVKGTTNLKDTNVVGKLDVTQKATFHNDVDITGDVTAKSYKVGDKTYISADGINANDQKITNVADGSISEGSKDAVNGGQIYGMKTDLEHKVDKVGANAAAMANLHPMEFDPDSKWNIAAAMGNYGSETATAIGAFYRPNEDVMVNFSTAFGTGENMVGGGVSVRLGKGSNKLSREESNALKDQVDDLTARMDALLSVLNPNMSKDFPDVPENHWAYEAVSRLAGNDIVQGYPDGEFHGDRTMTRYEMAEIIYNALSRGAEAERELVEEFKPELQAMAASEKATAERAEG